MRVTESFWSIADTSDGVLVSFSQILYTSEGTLQTTKAFFVRVCIVIMYCCIATGLLYSTEYACYVLLSKVSSLCMYIMAFGSQ